MVPRPFRQRSGFSLVELAVVIVVIGLLVGGVAAWHNYIRNAQLTTMVDEAKFYMNSFAAFQQKYNAVPGDFATASSVWPTAFNGDGNGQIRSSFDPSTYSGTNNEMYYAFQHLNLAGLIDGSYTGAGGGECSICTNPGVNIPRSSMDGGMYLLDHPTQLDGNVSGDGYYFDGVIFHVLRIAAMLNGTSPIANDPLLTPAQAMQIDTKFDDGRPGTGWIMTPKSSALPNCATADDPNVALYNTGYTGVACVMLMRIP